MNWRSDALCAQIGVQEFTYLEIGDPGVPSDVKRGLGELRYNEDRLLMAADSCYDCPVMIQCGNSATEIEKFWTVRGGELPTIMQTGVRKDHCPTAETKDYLPDVCRRGHNNWLERADGRGRYCGDCNNPHVEKESQTQEVHWLDA